MKLNELKLQKEKEKQKPDGVFGLSFNFALFFLLFLLPGCVTPFNKPTAEYHQKAVDLANFGQFVEWPPSTFPNAKSPLVIGLLGGNPFGNELQNIVAKGNINGHPVLVRRMNAFSNLKQCQVLFIDHSVTSRLPLIFDSLDDAPVLTVGETDSFLKAGGIINFVTENGKVRFDVAPVAAQKTGLKLSSQLLTMAVRVAPLAGPKEMNDGRKRSEGQH